MQFLLDDTCMWFRVAEPIISYTTGIILDSNLRYQVKKNNYRILTSYVRDDIVEEFVGNGMQMEKNKIQCFLYSLDWQCNGAWVENHLQYHQAIIAICCQTPLVFLIDPEICTGGFFNMLNPNLLSDFLLDHCTNTS